MTLERLPEQGTWLHVRTGNDQRRLLVVFSAANARSFTFYKQTIDLSCDKLYVRDPYLNAWYQRGFISDGDLAASMRMMTELASEYDEVSMVGSSMGAYAAILFGRHVKADRILAIGPQTQLNPKYARSPPPNIELLYPDISHLVASSVGGQMHIMVGMLDAVDFNNVARVGECEGVRLSAFWNEDHFLPKSLAKRGILFGLIGSVAEGRVPVDPLSGADEVYRFDDKRAQAIRLAVPLLFEAKSYREVRDLMQPFVDQDPEWPLGRYLWAAAAFKDGMYAPALDCLRGLASERPAAVDYNALAAEAALNLGKRDEAQQFANNILRVRPNYSRARLIVDGIAVSLRPEEAILDEAPPI